MEERKPNRRDANESPAEEQVFDGIGVAPGIAMAPAYVYARDTMAVEHRRVDRAEIEAETERFERAVTRAERDLGKIISVAREKLGEGSASIFEAQLLMLRDEAFFQAVLDRIRREHCSADSAVEAVMSKHRRLLETSENEYLRERANDLLDVRDRIVRHLRRGKIMSSVDSNTIVVSENLTAADIILFTRRNILGCAMDFGGPTSHVSIMARALGLPAVVSLHGITARVQTGDMMVLDGLRGRVIVNPTPSTLEYYRTRQRRYRRLLQEQKHLVPLPAETLDGHRMVLRANLELTEELRLLEKYGAEGIGLFRTEMFFLMQGRLSVSEDEQFEAYRQVVEQVGPAGSTFRVLDLGGDKMMPMAHREQNPFLGWRGIRVLLDKPEILKPQLRAILRASAYGSLRILLPMVTYVDEVLRFRAIMEHTMAELTEEGHAFDRDVPLGIMVEVPAVALLADRFAEVADFFSLGTNDLTQYVLAVDRGNDLVSDKYQELHPAVLALIKHVVEAGHRHGIPVSICGELAANPRATPVLMGLGLDELSTAPPYLLEVKRVVRAMKKSEAEAVAREALNATDAREINRMLDVWLEEHACGLLHFLDVEASKPRSLGPAQQVGS